jgi:hypothetical protein
VALVIIPFTAVTGTAKFLFVAKVDNKTSPIEIVGPPPEIYETVAQSFGATPGNRFVILKLFAE